MKEKDRPNFHFVPYSNIIINDKYIIYESKIFYLYQTQPLDHGIMDMEELAEIPDVENPNRIKKYIIGPNLFTGSDKMTIVYNINNSL